MKTRSLFFTGLTVILTSTLIGCSNSNSTNDDSNHNKEIKTAKEKKASSNKDRLNLSKSDVKKFNQSLSDGLSEDQSYASSGDDGYEFSQYISTLSYDSNRGLRIQVTSDFLNLSENDKNTIAGNTVGLAETQLIIIGKNKNGTDKIHSNVYQDETKLGSAKFSNNREFNWK